MNIRSAIAKSLHRLAEIVQTRSTSADRFWRSDSVESGGAVLGDAYRQSVWVYACVQAIAENVANIPFRFSLDGRRGNRLIETGPLTDLFDRPNEQINRYDWWELLVSWLMLRGKAYIVGVDNQGRVVRLTRRLRGDPVPTSLYILPADQVSRIQQGNTLAGWRYMQDRDTPIESQLFLPEEILVIRLPSVFSPIEGMSPLDVARLAAETDYAAARFMRGVMLNNADQGLIVSTDRPLDDAQREQILSALRERKRLAGTADRPIVLEGGLRVERPPLSAADLQFLENRKYSRQEICAVFRVPQEILGYTEDANRSVSEAQRANFIDHRIEPFCYRLEAAIAPIIDAYDDLVTGWFDVDSLPIRAAARRSRVDVAVKLWGMGYPANRINEYLDLGLPDIDGGDIGYLPFSVTPASGLSTSQPNEPKTFPEVTGDKDGRDRSRSAVAAVRNPFKDVASFLHDLHVCVSSQAYLRSIRASVALKRRRLSRYVFEQRSRVLAALAQYSEESIASIVSASHRSLADDIFDVEAEHARLKELMRPMMVADLHFGGAQLWQEMAQPGEFAIPPDAAIEYLRLRENALRNVNETTFLQLKGTLEEGLQKGETMEELIERVRSVFRSAAEHRIETIALTETNTAVNRGRFAGIQSAGLELKAWLSSNLAGARATHQQAGREYADGIPVDRPFRVGGEDLMYPGDPNGSPGNVINCKCAVIAVAGKRGERIDETRMFGLRYEDWLPEFAASRSPAAGSALRMPQEASQRSGGYQHTTPAPKTKMQ